MAISEDNTKTLIVMPKSLKAELEKEAEAVQRSLSNYIVWVLSNRKETK